MTLLHTTKKGSIKTPQILEKKNGILKKSLLFCYVDNSCHPEGLARQHMNENRYIFDVLAIFLSSQNRFSCQHFNRKPSTIPCGTWSTSLILEKIVLFDGYSKLSV